MRLFCVAASLGLLTAAGVAAHARAEGDAPERPRCVPADAVWADLQGPGLDFLTRLGGDDVRGHLARALGDGAWLGRDYLARCTRGSTPVECVAATIRDGAEEAGIAQALVASGAVSGTGAEDFFPDLARRAGRSASEAQALEATYRSLQGSQYRHVQDEDGNWMNEDVLILRKHRRALGITDPDPAKLRPAGEAELKARAAKLKERAQAAKKRGDTAELMRIAEEAQRLTAPTQEKLAALDRLTARQTWALLESAHGELASAAYRTWIHLSFECSCTPCDPPPRP